MWKLKNIIVPLGDKSSHSLNKFSINQLLKKPTQSDWDKEEEANDFLQSSVFEKRIQQKKYETNSLNVTEGRSLGTNFINITWKDKNVKNKKCPYSCQWTGERVISAAVSKRSETGVSWLPNHPPPSLHHQFVLVQVIESSNNTRVCE